jgi:hypothetical protein
MSSRRSPRTPREFLGLLDADQGITSGLQIASGQRLDVAFEDMAPARGSERRAGMAIRER